MSVDIITLRGYLEKMIDLQLSKENLVSMHTMFEALRPAVSNRESAIFGYIVGRLVASVWSVIYTIAKRELTQEETKEVVETILRRSLEIRNRIMETST